MSADRKNTLRKRAEKAKRRQQTRSLVTDVAGQTILPKGSTSGSVVTHIQRAVCSACGTPAPRCTSCGRYMTPREHDCNHPKCKYRGIFFECDHGDPFGWDGTEGFCDNPKCPSIGTEYDCPNWPDTAWVDPDISHRENADAAAALLAGVPDAPIPD